LLCELLCLQKSDRRVDGVINQGLRTRDEWIDLYNEGSVGQEGTPNDAVNQAHLTSIMNKLQFNICHSDNDDEGKSIEVKGRKPAVSRFLHAIDATMGIPDVQVSSKQAPKMSRHKINAMKQADPDGEIFQKDLVELLLQNVKEQEVVQDAMAKEVSRSCTQSNRPCCFADVACCCYLFVSVCLFVCASLSVCLSVCASLFVSLCLAMSVCLSLCLCLCISVLSVQAKKRRLDTAADADVTFVLAPIIHLNKKQKQGDANFAALLTSKKGQRVTASASSSQGGPAVAGEAIEDQDMPGSSQQSQISSCSPSSAQQSQEESDQG
jgi:hypothetical protein